MLPEFNVIGQATILDHTFNVYGKKRGLSLFAKDKPLPSDEEEIWLLDDDVIDFFNEGYDDDANFYNLDILMNHLEVLGYKNKALHAYLPSDFICGNFFISEKMLYDIIVHIEDFRLERVQRKIIDIVNTIRKHGVYATDDFIADMQFRPEKTAKKLRQMHKEHLEQKIKRQIDEQDALEKQSTSV